MTVNENASIYCISLWQPWASLLAHGKKRMETRHWRFAFYYVGKTFVIHAAKKWDDTILRTAYLPEFDAALTEAGQHPGKLPLGCALGTATLVRTDTTEAVRDLISDRERAFGNYDDERFIALFEDFRPFAKPLPLRGQQGIWQWQGKLPAYADALPSDPTPPETRQNLFSPTPGGKLRRID